MIGRCFVEMISVVIPAYNEETVITETLTSLFAAIGNRNKSFEIIVVDAGSDDRTAEISENLLSSSDINGSVVKMGKHTMPGKARNAGIKKARYENIVMIDSGVFFTKQVVDECLENTGRCDFVWFKSEFMFKNKYEASYVRPYFAYREKGRYIRHCMARKQVIENLGCFNEHLRAGEDWIFYRHVNDGNFKEYFSSTTAQCSGFPEGLAEFTDKWTTYFENSVYAGFGLRNLRTSMIQAVILLLPAVVFLWIGMGWILSIAGSIALFVILRGVLSFVRSRIKPLGPIDFLYTFLTSSVLEVCRIIGGTRGFLRNGK